jgi:hypothetical protein
MRRLKDEVLFVFLIDSRLFITSNFKQDQSKEKKICVF